MTEKDAVESELDSVLTAAVEDVVDPSEREDDEIKRHIRYTCHRTPKSGH